MGKYIHNKTEESITILGKELAPNEVFKIPQYFYTECAEDDSLLLKIDNGDITVSYDGINELGSIKSQKQCLQSTSFRSCLAVDKNGTNQTITTTTATVISKNRALWDFNGDYDDETDDIVIPIDGVYSFDMQLKVNSFFNCKTVEIALYKRGDPDDYWFILDKATVVDDFVQLSNSTLFDFYEGERYCLKIILEKTSVLLGISATINGDDDYTSWGYNLLRII